ncbi:hypothetical protein OS493_006121 [Desmophyllum pertusum]|uniref:EGF-like domain-containing protein n=1 Tax=Desmophyllum pertusum TaxID=174260 RepID=A0A9X0A513_9CNID|nr:hypothetical protein OS493_006121 [Desmophyllum pertusum]
MSPPPLFYSCFVCASLHQMKSRPEFYGGGKITYSTAKERKVGRFIRIFPMSYKNKVCMKMEVYGEPYISKYPDEPYISGKVPVLVLLNPWGMTYTKVKVLEVHDKSVTVQDGGYRKVHEFQPDYAKVIPFHTPLKTELRVDACVIALDPSTKQYISGRVHEVHDSYYMIEPLMEVNKNAKRKTKKLIKATIDKLHLVLALGAMKMNVTRVLPLVGYTRPAKTLRSITSANAPGVSRVKTPARKTVKISMSARRKFVTRMRNVVTPRGVFLVLAREDLKAMATRAAWKLMSAKLLLIRKVINVTSTANVWTFQVDIKCECKQGYHGDGIQSCEIANECKLGTHKCHKTWATCVDTAQSYECHCKDGFEGDGRSCKDINECDRKTHKCPDIVGAKCVNTDGSYKCICLTGFTGNGKNCQNINECKNGVHTCAEYAVCTDKIGSYECNCKEGFKGDPKKKMHT